MYYIGVLEIIVFFWGGVPHHFSMQEAYIHLSMLLSSVMCLHLWSIR